MILFSNGCSWTWGGGLNLDHHNDLRNNSVWPKKLSDLLGTEKYYNLAAGCGSNQRIVRTTFDWILSQTKEDLDKTVAIIQWTELSRYEFYYPSNNRNEYENHQSRWVRCKVDCILNQYDDNESAKKKYNDLRLSTYTEIEGMYRFIGDLLAVENLLTQHNIPYYFWTYDTRLLERFPKEIYEFCKSRFNWLNSIDTKEWQYDRVSDDDPHPSFLGHEQIAQFLAEHIKTNTSS
jgi:hypothetical protein